MRLINTETLELVEFFEEPFPPYAILSHRWGQEEVTFQEFQTGAGRSKQGFAKIKGFCSLARDKGYQWCWVDTCGIDKTSSAELSESINSMYSWYERSGLCCVYLADFEANDGSKNLFESTEFQDNEWFKRGWTLQELIGPRVVEFYDREWRFFGDKETNAGSLSKITSINGNLLRGKSSVREYSTAGILSWASFRRTTRKEDIAYCLMGLFSIHMPLLYGEGDQAFIRLQEEILKKYADQSIFAWNPPEGDAKNSTDLTQDQLCGVLAPSAACFKSAGDVIPSPGYWNTESTITNQGIRVRLPLLYNPSKQVAYGIISCENASKLRQHIAIELISACGSYGENDHLIRRLRPVIYDNFIDQKKVEFRTVYLVTASAFSLARRQGFEYLKVEPEFGILVSKHSQLFEHPTIADVYPPQCYVDHASTRIVSAESKMRMLTLAPVRCSDYYAAVVLRTSLRLNIVVMLGFPKGRGGFPDTTAPWESLYKAPKHIVAKDAFSDFRSLIKASEIEIDKYRIKLKRSAQPWHAPQIRTLQLVIKEGARTYEAAF